MSYLLISFQILICDWLRIDIESHALMEKLDKTKVKVLEQASNEDSSKTAGTNAASTEVRLFLPHCSLTIDMVLDFQLLAFTFFCVERCLSLNTVCKLFFSLISQVKKIP